MFFALERAVKEDKTLDRNYKVKEIFASWSNQKGFPLLNVTRNYQNGSITLSQERYLTTPSTDIDPSTWWIPYNIATLQNSESNNTFATGWLPQNTRSIVIEPSAAQGWTNSDWVLFNKHQTGYYRVIYDERNYKLIASQLNAGSWESIDVLSRSALIDDLADFARTKRISYAIFFDLIKYLQRETEYAPWVSASRAINHLNKVLAGSVEYQKFKTFIKPLAKSFYKWVGLEERDDELFFVKYKRTIATDLACEFGVKSCLTQTHEALLQILKTGVPSSQHNRAVIYSNGIRSANSTEVKALWNRFTTLKNQDERLEITNSFGYIGKEQVLQQYLNRTLVKYDDIRFTAEERTSTLLSIAQRSQYGLSIVINLLRNHIDDAKEQLVKLDEILTTVAESICTHKLHHSVSAMA